MVKPSNSFLEQLKSARGTRKLSESTDLDGFRQDLHEYLDEDSRGPFRHRNQFYSEDEACKIVSEFDVVDKRSWAELRNEILQIWNEHIAYAHSGFEFTEELNALVFHFFTYEDDNILFVTGQAIFRRS